MLDIIRKEKWQADTMIDQKYKFVHLEWNVKLKKLVKIEKETEGSHQAKSLAY